MRIYKFEHQNKYWILQICLSICLLLTGCSSNGGSTPSEPPADSPTEPPAEPPKVVVEPNQKLSTAPHAFDIYRATNADTAIVFLHGAMGTKHFFAYQLGFNLINEDTDYSAINEQVLLDNKILAVFPQGQAVADAPRAYTWNNYVMTSGQDDMQFIRDLVSYVSSTYSITRFYIVGHSNGGMMANRIWCEEPGLFEGYVAIAGPPSERFLAPGTSCAPAQVKSYMGIVGSDDNVLQVTGNWASQTWSINPFLLVEENGANVNPVMIGERYFLPFRVAQGCGEMVRDGDADAVTQGSVTSWSFCNDSIKLLRIESGRHTLESLQSTAGMSIMDLVLDFAI